MDFWALQPVQNLTVIALFVAATLLAVVVVCVPRFFSKVVDSILYHRTTLFFSKLATHMSPRLFVLATKVHSAILLALVSYLLAFHWHELPLWAVKSPELALMWLAVAFSLLHILYLLSDRLWLWLYLSQAARLERKQYYLLTEWVWSLWLYPMGIAFMYPSYAQMVWVSLPIWFVGWRLWVSVYTLAQFRQSGMPLFHLFLYLCAHEVAPMALLSFLVGYVNING